MLHEFTDDLEVSGKLHIVPGMISHNGKPYRQIRGSEMEPRMVSLDTTHRFSKFTMNVTETIDNLYVWFELTGTREDASPLTLDVCPTDLVLALQRGRGWVHCKILRCKQVVPAFSGSDDLDTDVFGAKVRIVQGNTLIRCATILVGHHWRYKCILKGNECIQCCIRTALTGMKDYDLLKLVEGKTTDVDASTSGRYIIVDSS